MHPFHLVVETANGNLVAGMRWLLSAYTLRFNPRHQRFGHVFSGRYKALVVDGSGNGYLRTVCDYVHRNPVRARRLPPGQRLLEYPWSSFGGYLAALPHRPSWLRVDRLLGEHGIARDTVAGRREFEQRLEARRAAADNPAERQAIRRGWCLGPASFKAEMLERMEGRAAHPLADCKGRANTATSAIAWWAAWRRPLGSQKLKWRMAKLGSRG